MKKDGNIDIDPGFLSMGYWDDNGTSDVSDDDFFVAGDYRLRGDSVCINAGDPAGDYSGEVDLDGNARVRYGRVDMGAYEVFPVGADVDADEKVGLGDFARFAGAWLSADGEEAWDDLCDVNGGGDGVIDLEDLKVLVNQWVVPSGT